MSTSPTYNLSSASRAIGVSDATLRNWIKRESIEGLEGTGSGKGPALPADIVYELAFTAELISVANFRVADAYKAMHQALGQYEGFEWWQLPPKLYVFPNTPEGVKIFDDENPMLTAYQEPVFSDWKEWPDTFRREFGVSLPEGDPLHPSIWDGQSHIVIYPHSIVRHTKRVLESAR